MHDFYILLFPLTGCLPYQKKRFDFIEEEIPGNPKFVKKIMCELYSKEYFELHKKTHTKSTVEKDINKIPMANLELKAIKGKLTIIFCICNLIMNFLDCVANNYPNVMAQQKMNSAVPGSTLLSIGCTTPIRIVRLGRPSRRP